LHFFVSPFRVFSFLFFVFFSFRVEAVFVDSFALGALDDVGLLPATFFLRCQL
jgi:uncharacterized iron-regulated protein